MVKTSVVSEGFEGVLYEAAPSSSVSEKKCLILNLLFAPNSSFAKKPALWLNSQGISALAIGVYATKETPADQSQIPIEYITKACAWLKKRGYQKIGTLGLSFGAEMGLYAASICPDITLTVAISGYDRVFEGVLGRGTQYPSGKSSYTKDGKDVPFQSLGLTKEGYIKRMADEKKAHGENYGRDMWEEAIQKNPNDAAVIPVEKICGRVLFLGSETDTCWDSTGAATRMEERIKADGTAEVRRVNYPHACHLLYPDMVPFINFMTRMAFKEYKKYPAECKAARKDVSAQILKEVKRW